MKLQQSLVLIVVAVVGLTSALLGRGQTRDVELFSPSIPRVYLHNINGSTVDVLPFVKATSSEKALDIALDYVSQLFGSDIEYVVKSEYTTKHNQVHHSYLRQTLNGLEIFNADMNINTWNQQILSAGHSFYFGSQTAGSPTKSSIQAVVALAKHIGVDISIEALNAVFGDSKINQKIKGLPTVTDVKATLGYMILDGGEKLEIVWNLETDFLEHAYNAFVSATDLRIVALFDWVYDINVYEAYPISVNDPQDGARQRLESPATEPASPEGWNRQSASVSFTDTRGNNVYAQENWSGGSQWQNNQRPSGGPGLDFIFEVDFTQDPKIYINASSTNLFVWNNFIHDIFYQYGFDEISGNFQENNFGRGGLGNDAVQANAQDGAGFNNANFMTPPDGQRPRMRMYVWNTATPYRDGDLEQGIIIHEYAHGISNRLTGGPSNVNCLGSGEAGGMGEGWGDFFGTALRQKPGYTRDNVFPMGAYAANNPKGIRKYPYTTDMAIDPETYAYINNADYTGVHAKGEVWTGILWETYWNFVDDHGFSTNWYLGEGGNNRILADVVDGLKLQPCTPNFVSARDAILQADKVNWNGENVCRLWKGFAKRGLGINAVGTSQGVTRVVEDFTLPPECA